jgi:hypothetical protein
MKNMKNYLFVLSIFCLVLSCKKEKGAGYDSKLKKDTITEAIPNYKFNENSVFGVYQLTDKDFAICIPVQFDNEDLPLSKKYEDFLAKDSLPWIYGKDMKDYKYYDTLFVDKLIYNKRFEDVFKKEMKESYFVYGTKSFQECRVKRVIFQSNECGSDYIAYVLNVDEKITGNPLIASEKQIPLTYGKNYTKTNKSIKKIAAKESTENTYGQGHYNPITYANVNNLYFTYYDDFKWYKKDSGSDCQFPERAVFRVDSNGKIELLWSSELDLLGLPCL